MWAVSAGRAAPAYHSPALRHCCYASTCTASRSCSQNNQEGWHPVSKGDAQQSGRAKGTPVAAVPPLSGSFAMLASKWLLRGPRAHFWSAGDRKRVLVCCSFRRLAQRRRAPTSSVGFTAALCWGALDGATRCCHRFVRCHALRRKRWSRKLEAPSATLGFFQR